MIENAAIMREFSHVILDTPDGFALQLRDSAEDNPSVVNPGMLQLPGGGAKPEERPMEAMIREGRSELGRLAWSATLLDWEERRVMHKTNRNGVTAHIVLNIWSRQISQEELEELGDNISEGQRLVYVPHNADFDLHNMSEGTPDILKRYLARQSRPFGGRWWIKNSLTLNAF